jgi:hypothetical protein
MAFSYRHWRLAFVAGTWRGTRNGDLVTAPSFCALLIALSRTPLIAERCRQLHRRENQMALIHAYLADEAALDAEEGIAPPPLRPEYVALLAQLQAWQEAVAAEEVAALEAWHETPEAA